MKKVAVLVSFCLMTFSLVSCKQGNASAKIKKENLEKALERDEKILSSPIAEFDMVEYDFGTVTEGEVIETVFKLKNVGKSDLIITDAKTTCGCTVPTWPRNKPVKPGETTDIKVKFNTTGKGGGKQVKRVTLHTNTEKGREIVTVKGNVTRKKKTV